MKLQDYIELNLDSVSSSYLCRQVLISSINEGPDPDAANIEEITVNGKTMPYSEMNNGCMEWADFRTQKFL